MINGSYADCFYRIYLSDRIFDDSLRLDCRVLVGNLTMPGELKLVVSNSKGFLIDVAPLFVYKNNGKSSKTEISLRFCNLKFFDIDFNRLNASSSNQILMRYFRISDPNVFNKKNRSTLLKRYKSPFGFAVNKFSLTSSLWFHEPLSPILFKLAQFRKFTWHGFTNTSIRRFFLDFVLNDDLLADLTESSFSNTLIPYFHELEIYSMFNVALNDRLINKHAMRFTCVLSVLGILRSIDDDLFIPFKYMKKIDLFLDNLSEFYHSSYDLKWIRSLNPNVYLDLDRLDHLNDSDYLRKESLRVGVRDRNSYYKYPNEDICLFRHLNHSRLAFLAPIQLDTTPFKNVLVDTCTQLHMTKHLHLMKNFSDDYNNLMIHEHKNETAKCNLDEMLSLCFNITSNQVYRQPDQRDFFYTIHIIELIGPIITFPIVTVIGAITNLLIIFVIYNKRNESTLNENRRLFTYLAVNSAFNAIECILSSFRLMSECLGTNSLYCSTIMNMESTQKFKIFVVEYFGEVMKTCSVITMLLFSLERYRLTKGKKNRLLDALANVRSRNVFISLVSFAFLTCLNKLNEYDAYFFYFDQNEYPTLVIFRQMGWNVFFTVTYLIHYIFNDFLALLVNTLVDIWLVNCVKANLRQKKKFNLNLLDKSHGRNKQAQLKLEEIIQTEKNTNQLILYSLLTYVFCRLPELILYMYFVNPTLKIDYLVAFGPTLVNIIQYMYVLSYVTNLFFYIKFNKPFRIAFYNIFGNEIITK